MFPFLPQMKMESQMKWNHVEQIEKNHINILYV